jgi:hypothetical protein
MIDQFESATLIFDSFDKILTERRSNVCARWLAARVRKPRAVCLAIGLAFCQDHDCLTNVAAIEWSPILEAQRSRCEQQRQR